MLNHVPIQSGRRRARHARLTLRVWLRTAAAAAVMACTVAAAAPPDVQVRALFPGKALLEIDGTRVVLSEGTTGPRGVRLIDATPKAAVISIDGQRRRLSLTSRAGGTYAAATPRQMRLSPDTRGRYMSNGRINGRPVRFLVDTGADMVAINAAMADGMGLDYQESGTRIRVNTASGATTGWRVTFDRVRLGEVVVQGVDGMVLPGGAPSTPLLGMSFLGRVNLRHEGRVLVIEQH